MKSGVRLDRRGMTSRVILEDLPTPFQTPWSEKMDVSPRRLGKLYEQQSLSMASMEANWMNAFNDPGQDWSDPLLVRQSEKMADLEAAWMR